MSGRIKGVPKKKWVVDWPKPRITVRNILDELEEYGLIVARKDKPNSQIYRLYINSENDLASALSHAQQFKSIYSVLLEIGKKRIEEMESGMTISNYERRRIYPLELELLEALLYVNRYFINSYMVFLQFNSHDRFKDEETLKRIHLTVTKVIREIHDLLLDTISAASSFLRNKNKTDLESLVTFGYIETDLESFYLLKRVFDNNRMEIESEPIMSFLWGDGSRFRRLDLGMLSLAPKLEHLWDWKKVLKVFGDAYEDPKVIHTKYQNRILRLF